MKIYEKSSKFDKNHQKSSILTIFGTPPVFGGGGSKNPKNDQKTSIFDHFWVKNDRKSYGAMLFEDHFTKS